MMKHTFPIRLQQDQDLIIVQKPTGMNTHRPDPDKPGLIEFLEAQLGSKLYVVHRLDKETSGIILFSKTQSLAQNLGTLFEGREIQKEYLFLTDRKTKSTELSVESEILKKDDQFVSLNNGKPNSKTKFLKLKEGPVYTLWKALPETGKPHQIRLHAEAAQIPILGDAIHGGSPYFRLCLHAAKISFLLNEQKKEFSSPIWFDENSSEDPSSHWQEALWKRRQFLDLSHATTARVSHDESTLFRLDQMGSQYWMGWYGSQDPDLNSPLFQEILKVIQGPLWIRQMKSRGGPKGPQAFLKSCGEPKAVWSAEENGIQYEMRSEQGLSPGLFLDQRENRAWVKSVSSHKRVLNLFSYTGAFSLNAALGGASEVCTVDVSRVFIDWSKHNFKMNGLDPDSKNFEFWFQDSLLFLKGCQKRQRQFDLIICDPPTLGRTKDGTFDLKRDLKELLQRAWACLAEGGSILFACNYEGWDLKDFRHQCEMALSEVSPKKNSLPVKIHAAPGSPLDFESSPHESLMKSLILQKNSSKT